VATTAFKSRPLWVAVLLAVLLVGTLSTSAGRQLAEKWLSSLRLQKTQTVNLDLSPFFNAGADPALHQMVSQMISDKVEVTVNEDNKAAVDRAAAGSLAGFPVQLIEARKDAPKLVVGGRHELKMSVDRARLQEILKAAGHPEIQVPKSLDGASFEVQIPRTLHAQYGTCPSPPSTSKTLASQVLPPTPATGKYTDCVRLTEGPEPVVKVPAGLDIQKLAEIGLEAAGMSPDQSDKFFQAVDWRSTLTMSVPRRLNSYEQVKVNGATGTLLTLASRRGPGYTLLWTKGKMAYSLTGFGDYSGAVALADSLQ
jgi:hypothetical protein